MINIIGGTYREIDYDDLSMDIMGSGFRGAKFLLENNSKVHFFTAANSETINFLKENEKVYQDLQVTCEKYDELITFKYTFSLAEPTIYPNILNISKSDKIQVEGENIIVYGMLETDFEITGEKVVYDPQTSVNPKVFTDFGYASDLVYIVNKREAETLASSKGIDTIKKYFLVTENAKAFIIKDGPFGATLFYKDQKVEIPSFITDNVNKIGSGDIFTSSFAYYWMEKQLSLSESAINASKTTALYCDKKAYVDSTKHVIFEYKKFNIRNLSKKQIYIAAPFFSISELMLVDKIRSAFLEFGVKVFSPFHDIGLGDDVTIANRDIEGIENSDIIFCIFDNLDSGTLVESGYSLARGKKIIGYHRTCKESDLLMLRPGNFNIYNHLTTAIYQTIWNI